MYGWRKSFRQAVRRRWFAEPLESRALLSALVAEYSADQVDVVELRPSDEVSSRNLERHELPLPVFQELETRFPGAIWESAEFDPSSESPYDVRVNWRGMNLEVALSSTGQMLEMEQAVPLAELPQAMRDWLAQQFPDAVIRDIDRVLTGATVTYSVEFVSDRPAVALEVTAGRVEQDAGESLMSPAAPPAQASNRKSEIAAVAMPDESGSKREAVQSLHLAERQTARDTRTEDSPMMALVASQSLRKTGSPPDPARADHSASPSSIPALADSLPVDLAKIERAMREFLDDVAAFLPAAPTGADVLHWTPSLVIAALAIYGIERLRMERGRTNRHPVLAAGASRSTWSWVLNLSSWSRSVERRP